MDDLLLQAQTLQSSYGEGLVLEEEYVDGLLASIRGLAAKEGLNV